DRDDPDTMAYLAAENAYTQAATAHLADLRRTVCEELKRRTQETDLSVPVRKRHGADGAGYWLYARTEDGRQYPLHCRRQVPPGEVDPPIPADGAPLPGEQVLLDGNVLAEGHEFFAMGNLNVSPDGRWLAYS